MATIEKRGPWQWRAKIRRLGHPSQTKKGLDMLEVASITGHKTLVMLKRYTHLRASKLAAKLG